MTPNESFGLGEFTVTALPAVDGFGEDQVSWVVETADKRIIHFGDTLWHGYWWYFAKTFGPFDVAFLPINGAVTRFPNMQPSEIPACLTPAQTVAAGSILGAKQVCLFTTACSMLLPFM